MTYAEITACLLEALPDEVLHPGKRLNRRECAILNQAIFAAKEKARAAEERRRAFNRDLQITHSRF